MDQNLSATQTERRFKRGINGTRYRRRSGSLKIIGRTLKESILPTSSCLKFRVWEFSLFVSFLKLSFSSVIQEISGMTGGGVIDQDGSCANLDRRLVEFFGDSRNLHRAGGAA